MALRSQRELQAWVKMGTEVKISVLIITYNHERYIAQALDSVLNQKMDFGYEIVIGDDCSTDGTQAIVSEYQKKCPGKIKLLLAEKNLGPTRNFIKTYRACGGQYVALLEGDDYWISPGKLQQQVDFLESHPEFVLCFTNSRIVNEYGEVIKDSRLDEDRRRNLTQTDIISGLVPPTNTVVFRNNIVTEIPDIFFTAVNGDIMFFSMLAEYGNAAYIDEFTGDYRVHDSGTWSNKSAFYMLKNNLNARLVLLTCFPKYKDILLPSVNGYYSELLLHYIKTRSLINIFLVAYRAFVTNLKFLNFGFLRILAHIFSKILSGKISTTS